MLPDLSRRSFLIGSAAALAVTQLPPQPVTLAPQPAVLPLELNARRIFDICATCEDVSSYAENPIISYALFVERVGQQLHGAPQLSFAMHRRNTLRWVAVPMSEIIVPNEYFTRFDVAPSDANLRMTLISKDVKDKAWIEDYRWQDGKLVMNYSLPMNALPEEEDDSLYADEEQMIEQRVSIFQRLFGKRT